MTKLKSKAAAVPVPQTPDLANAALAEIGALQRDIALAQNALAEHVAALKATAEAAVQPLTARVAALTAGLQIYAEANRNVLTDGGRRQSFQLPAGVCSWRQAPPSVSIKGADQVLAWLRERMDDAADPDRRRFAALVRVKHEINKQAMLDAPETAVLVPGVTIASKGEAFVVEPIGMPLASPAVPGG